MGIIDSVVRIVDFVFQGLILLLLVWYALHETKLFKRLFNRVLTAFPRNWITEAFLFTAVIGGSYALGLITNSVAFLALEPAHENVIKYTQATHNLHVFSLRLTLSPIESFALFARLNPPDQPTLEEGQHVESLCEDIAWENRQHDVAQAALEPLVKQLRVLRGAMLYLFLFVLVSISKLVIRMVRFLFGWHLPPRWPLPLLYGTIACLLYLICMNAWAYVEADYHLTVYYGVRTATLKTGETSPSPWNKECSKDIQADAQQVVQMLDDWYDAAARGDGPRYFSLFTDDAIFMGTDPQERWTLPRFRALFAPRFDGRNAWTYKAMERYVLFSADGQSAWFDEKLISPKYGQLRGTGVVVHPQDKWLIKRYSLTFVIPNPGVQKIMDILNPSANPSIPSKKMPSDNSLLAPHYVTIGVNFLIVIIIVWMLRCPALGINRILESGLLRLRSASLNTQFVRTALALYAFRSAGTLVIECFLSYRVAKGYQQSYLDWPCWAVLFGDVFAMASLWIWLNILRGTPRGTAWQLSLAVGIIALVDFVLCPVHNESWKLFPSAVLNVLALLFAIGTVTFRYPRRSTAFRIIFAGYALAEAQAYGPTLYGIPAPEALIYYLLGFCELILFLLLCHLLLGPPYDVKEVRLRNVLRRPSNYFRLKHVILVVALLLFILDQIGSWKDHPAPHIIIALVIFVAMFGVRQRRSNFDRLKFNEKFWRDFIDTATAREDERKLWDFKRTLTIWNMKGMTDEERDQAKVSFAEDVAAFANALGGVLIIGVEDASRSIVGVSDSHQERENQIRTAEDTLKDYLVSDTDTGSLASFEQILTSSKRCIVVVVGESPRLVEVKNCNSEYSHVIRREGNNIKLVTHEVLQLASRKMSREDVSYKFLFELEQFTENNRPIGNNAQT